MIHNSGMNINNKHKRSYKRKINNENNEYITPPNKKKPKHSDINETALDIKKKLNFLDSKNEKINIKLTPEQKKRAEKNRLNALKKLNKATLQKKGNNTGIMEANDYESKSNNMDGVRIIHDSLVFNEDIYVIDLETTDIHKDIKQAVVVEIGICKVNKIDNKVEPIFHCFIHPESYGVYPKNWKNSWIFRHGLDINKVLDCGLNFNVVWPEIRRILKQKYVTSYNAEFDINTFMIKPPYNVECNPFGCIMKLARDNIKTFPGYPSLTIAAKIFLGEDYRFSHHSALEDSITAAKILAKIYQNTNLVV